jgi:hypothetical protein
MFGLEMLRSPSGSFITYRPPVIIVTSLFANSTEALSPRGIRSAQPGRSISFPIEWPSHLLSGLSPGWSSGECARATPVHLRHAILASSICAVYGHVRPTWTALFRILRASQMCSFALAYFITYRYFESSQLLCRLCATLRNGNNHATEMVIIGELMLPTGLCQCRIASQTSSPGPFIPSPAGSSQIKF